MAYPYPLRARPVRRWLNRSLTTLAALALLMGLAWGWLFYSGSGRDFVLTRAQSLLGEERLSWQEAKGDWSAGVTLTALSLRLDSLKLEADQVEVSIHPSALWRGAVSIPLLQLTKVRLTPIASPTTATARSWSWPRSWPTLPLPLRIEIARLQLSQIAWLADPAAPVKARELSTGLLLSQSRIHLDAFSLSTDAGSANVDAEIGLGTDSAIDLRASVTATTGKTAPWQAQLRIDGSPRTLNLRLNGTAPGAFALDAHLREQQGQWRWQAQLRAQGIVPAAIGGPSGSFGADLSLNGIDASAGLSGSVQRDAQTLTIAPSSVSWQSPRLSLAPLQLELADGQLRIAGEIDLMGEAPVAALQVQASDLRWGDGMQQTRASGKAQVDGWIQAWQMQGNAELEHSAERAQLVLEADGDAQGASLRRLALATPAGNSELTGTVRFDDALGWHLQGKLDGLDPGWFAADYPGELAANIDAHGGLQDGVMTAHAQIEQLRGRLRQQRVRGSADFDFNGSGTSGSLDLFVGDSHVRAQGRINERIAAQISFSPLQLSDLLPRAHGQLSGELKLRGTRAQPLLLGELHGQNLVVADFKARSLTLHAQGDATGTAQARVELGGAVISDIEVDRLSIDASGNPGRIELQMSASSEGLAAELAGVWSSPNTSTPNKQPQFLLRSLRLSPAQGAAWQLQQPVQIVQAAAWQLPPTCLRSDDGEVCAEGTWPGTVELHARDLDLALARPWLRRDTVEFTLLGRIDIEANLRGGDDAPMQARAHARSGVGSLQLVPTTREAAFSWREIVLDARLDASGWHANLQAQTGARGHVVGRLDLAGDDDGPLKGTLDLEVAQLAWLELYSPDLAAPSGLLRGRLDLSGTRAAPRMSGELTLTDFAGELPALGLALRKSSARLSALADGTLTFSALLDSGEGVLHIDGDSALAANAPLRLEVTGSDVKVSDTAEITALISPELTLTRVDDTFALAGRIDLPKARIALDKRQAGAAARSADVVVLDPVAEDGDDTALALSLDLDLRVGKDVALTGFGLDGKLGGSLHVTRAVGRDPLGTGTITATGRYERYGKPLEIRHARLIYTRSPLDNPALDIRAQRTVDSQMVGVQISGTGLRPITTLLSDPTLESGDTLSWLVLGRPLQAARQDDGTSLNAAAMALGAGSNLLAEQLGTRLGLDQAGVSESRALGANTLMVGKFISPRLYVSYGVSLIGTGQVVALKYLLGHGFDLEIESGLESRGSLNWKVEH